jgi:hypothetical protein
MSDNMRENNSGIAGDKSGRRRIASTMMQLEDYSHTGREMGQAPKNINLPKYASSTMQNFQRPPSAHS